MAQALPSGGGLSSLRFVMNTVSLRPIVLRALFLIAASIGIAALSWPVARFAIGDSVMTFVQRNPNLEPEAQLQGADIAVRYAGNDPLLRMGRGAVYLASAVDGQNEEQMKMALEDFRLATKISPEDYRSWMSLGRALERSGDQQGARAALEKAINLAPRHFDPQWAMGNFLLRTGDRESAFVYFRQALISRPLALPLVFDYAWDAYQGDGRAIASALAPAKEAQAELAIFLIRHDRVEDAMNVWRNASIRKPREAEQVSTALIGAGRMAAAYEVWSSVPAENHPAVDAGSLLSNGDFEMPLTLNSQTPFLTWRIALIGGIKVSLDRKDPKQGQQTLRVGFDARENIPMTVISQTVPVKPSTGYVLTYAVKAEDLRSLSMPIVEVIDAADPRRLRIAAEKWPLGSGDWRIEQIKFTTDAKTEAVTVRLQREPCPEPPCPINGMLWLDSFRLIEAAK